MEDAPQQLDTGAESCKFPSDFPSTGQSVLLSVSQCKVPLNTWTRGLSPVSSHPTFLPLASLSYCLLASVRCPATPGFGGLTPVNSLPTFLPLASLLANVPLNTWTQGLSAVNSLPTFLPLASLSYCLSASVSHSGRRWSERIYPCC